MYSIIIPVYNCGQYLDNSIRSVLQQSDSDWELIVVDDGSTDDSGVKCNQYSLQDQRIKVIHSENNGPAAARNIGLEYASGDYILFLDADDMLEPTTIEYLKKSVSLHQPDLVIYSYVNDTFYQGRRLESVERKNSLKVCTSNDEFKEIYMDLDHNYMTYPVWNKLYKKEFINKIEARFPEGINVAEDFVFNLAIYPEAKKVVLLDRCLYHYILRDKGSMSQTFHRERIEQFKKVYKTADNILEQWLPEAKNGLDNMFIYEVSAYINKMFNENTNLKNSERKKIIRKLVNDPTIKNCVIQVKCIGFRNRIIKFLLKYKLTNLLWMTGKLSRINVSK